ncbi:hypothetical protein E8E13_010261 [Curvularia kusanoi]|uniref:tRNA(Phe) 7-[(3-amino-3-carboxypropyl)-4-demethylwyosine(37)-N(4)]-methyltransferase n=1 Tax=Curvularia kusanoi TaxID=90978 RepID=A0A9P4TJU1_CURKU|nr:hypothetical protein E8E13_010261 [Curvularia kusanoi]
MASRFEVRKQKILEQINVPDGEYHDLSPKGSIDAPIRELIGEINNIDGIVTTSSCSGRISVFLEGRKADNASLGSAEEGEESRAGPGGKGGGGTWLFISHDPVAVSDVAASQGFLSRFGLEETAPAGAKAVDIKHRFIHLKFEPMILHILSASLDHAQKLLNAGMGAGFRESGAVSLGSSKAGEANPVVAIRSTGYSFDSIIGYQDDEGRNISLISEEHLQTLVCIANDRFKINLERIARFRAQLLDSYNPVAISGPSKPDWEDADARKQRKRAEGLARQQALQAAKLDGNVDRKDESLDTLGVDVSPKMVETYKSRAAGAGLSQDVVDAVVADLFDKADPEPANLAGERWRSFDLATVGFGFHHFEDVVHAARQLKERLRPGGALVINDFLEGGDLLADENGDPVEGSDGNHAMHQHGHGHGHGHGHHSHEQGSGHKHGHAHDHAKEQRTTKDGDETDSNSQLRKMMNDSVMVPHFTVDGVKQFFTAAGFTDVDVVTLKERSYMEFAGKKLWRTILIAKGKRPENEGKSEL